MGDLSDSCLVRISDTDGAPTMPAVFVFEFKFMVSAAEGESLAGSHFVFQAGVPDPRTRSFQVAEVAFAPDGVRGTENLLFNYALAEVRDLDRFLGNWHQARIAYDMTDYTGSVWIDDRPIVSGVPLKTDLDVERAPTIALSRGPDVAVKLWIDDLDVRFADLSRMGGDRTELVFQPLFRDNFNRYESERFPGGGWLQGPGRNPEEAGSPGREAEEGGKVRRKAAVIDDRVYASRSRSFKLEGSEEEPGTVMKRFSLYYYASDQIRSTRIVTDSSGNVVYSAAHEPYGGIQQTWVTNYDPELKFSGKPRDAESGLDYFGARHYDRTQYRFLSPNGAARFGTISASHFWNAYSYPANNPWAEMYTEILWWTVSYPWVSRAEGSSWVLIKTSGEKRKSWKIGIEPDWHDFLDLMKAYQAEG